MARAVLTTYMTLSTKKDTPMSARTCSSATGVRDDTGPATTSATFRLQPCSPACARSMVRAISPCPFHLLASLPVGSCPPPMRARQARSSVGLKAPELSASNPVGRLAGGVQFKRLEDSLAG